MLSRKSKFIALIATLLFSGNLLASYCTQTNFDTGAKVYRQAEDSFNRALDILNPMIEQFNKEVFTHKKFTYQQILNAMMSNPDILESFKLQVLTLKAFLADNQKASLSFDAAKKRTPTAYGIWDKIAASCLEEVEPSNARLARENAKHGRNLMAKVEDNIKKYELITKTYNDEIDFLQQLVKGYQAAAKCE